MATTAATATVNSQSSQQYHKAFRHIQKHDAPTLINTAGAVTYLNTDILGGIILRDPNGADRVDVLPTAALLVALLRGEEIGDVINVVIMNCAAANKITVSAGAGGAFDANIPAAAKDIALSTSKVVRIRLTNITAGSEAYVVYM